MIEQCNFRGYFFLYNWCFVKMHSSCMVHVTSTCFFFQESQRRTFEFLGCAKLLATYLFLTKDCFIILFLIFESKFTLFLIDVFVFNLFVSCYMKKINNASDISTVEGNTLCPNLKVPTEFLSLSCIKFIRIMAYSYLF